MDISSSKNKWTSRKLPDKTGPDADSMMDFQKKLLFVFKQCLSIFILCFKNNKHNTTFVIFMCHFYLLIGKSIIDSHHDSTL